MSNRALWLCAGVLLLASPAAAQYGSRPTTELATGERYHVEVSLGTWNPTPDLVISSESLGIVGSEIDLVQDLGVGQTRFTEFRAVLRPARKHKFRVSYTPIRYTAETVLERTIVFNGIRYRVGLPVNASADWDAWRFGYEYDLIYRERGYLGLILEAKYTDVSVALESPVAAEFARARAPIPAIGAVGRVYVLPNIAITGELTGFKLPANIDERYRATYIDFDLNGTINFTNNVGAQLGYRSLDVNYLVEDDSGDLRLNGIYLSAVLRF